MSAPERAQAFCLMVVVEASLGADERTVLRDSATSPLFTTEFCFVGDAPGRAMPDLVNEAAARVDVDAVAIVSSAGAFVGVELERALALLTDEGLPDCVYGDTRIASDEETVLRPILDPERLRCQYYFGPVVVWRASAIRRLGGLRAELPGAELHDLALRGLREGVSISSLRGALFRVDATQRTALDDEALRSVRRALEEHLAATGGGEIVTLGADGVHDTRRPVTGDPLISIVIPTRGLASGTGGEAKRHSFVVEAVRSVVERSTYRNFELIVVIDDVAESAVVDELRALGGERLRFVEWSQPFNFSSKVNLGAAHARGEYLLLLNDDVQVISESWLEALLSLAQLDNAGMVGAMLYYDDDSIQHAGHAYYNGDASHIGLDVPRGSAGPLDGYRVEREVAGVTAACAMMPTAVYHEVGGLSDLLPGNFNDVDLCMKTTWLGHQIYWTPHAELYHFESRTRDASVRAFEVDVAWGRWGFRMHQPEFWPYPLDREPS